MTAGDAGGYGGDRDRGGGGGYGGGDRGPRRLKERGASRPMGNPSTSAISRSPADGPADRAARLEQSGESGARTNDRAAEASASAAARATTSRPLESNEDATRRLRAQYAEISQLAGGLAHEIRNPLSTLSLNLDLLLEDFQNPETARDRRVLLRLERLRPEVHRLHGILESFLRLRGCRS